MTHASRAAAVVLGVVLGAACDAAERGKTPLTRAELLDPETCKQCHDKHYTEWSASMHAYAARDPVFLAMNAQGQKDTDGALGDFCVSCHAPMAVREGAFANGDFTDFEQVPDHLEGVTCYFCHNVVDVERDHNNGLVLANDTTMRGGIRGAVQPWAHAAAYDVHFDDNAPESSRLCGSCHDIVNTRGFHLERTYEEYQKTVFATSRDPFARLSCSDCHMPATPRDETIATYTDAIVPARPRHVHLWPAVDVPLTPNPGREAMVSAVARFALPQSITLFTLEPLFVDATARFRVQLETGAGHRQPSGAAQDRRMWLEWIAYDESGGEIARSGTIADDALEPGHDPELWLMRDILYADEAKTIETHKFWEAVAFDQGTIPEPTTLQAGSHSLGQDFALPLVSGQMPKRIEIRLRMRPMGRDVLTELVDGGYLDEAIMDEMPTFTMFAATAEWPDPSRPDDFSITEDGDLADDREYLCLLHPKGGYCD